MDIKYKIIDGEDFYHVIIDGKKYHVDREGYLISFKKWTPEWMTAVIKNMKKNEMIIMKDHFEIINFIKEYYFHSNRHPSIKVIAKQTGFKLMHIFELFPSGINGIYKAAGLPPKL